VTAPRAGADGGTADRGGPAPPDPVHDAGAGWEAAYGSVTRAPRDDRRDLFLAAAARLGTPLGNVEKDFWVCWTLAALFRSRTANEPRLLFKGGTSLSKAYGLIERFSEDVDVTVFRDDLGAPASVEALAALSGKKRQARLDAIRDACRAYVTGPLRSALAARVADATDGAGRVTVDPADPDGQSLLVAYPTIETAVDPYVRPVVRIESGAKSALEPHRAATVRPYVAGELPAAAASGLTVGGVLTIEPARTFWDKVVIAHGLRRWYERRGALRQEGQRVSRHYYDLHRLSQADVGRAALADWMLGADCVRHARVFFDRPDFDLASARPGTFALAPAPGMVEALARDYAAMTPMIFGRAPAFAEVLTTIREIEGAVNA